jgi:hypothetical protein
MIITLSNPRGKSARKIAKRHGIKLATLSLLWGHTIDQYRLTLSTTLRSPFHPAWYRRKLKGIVDKRVESDVEW